MLCCPALLGSAAVTAHWWRPSSAPRRRCTVGSSSWAPRGRPPGTAAAPSASASSSPPCPWCSSAAAGGSSEREWTRLCTDTHRFKAQQVACWRGRGSKLWVCGVILMFMSLLCPSVVWSLPMKHYFTWGTLTGPVRSHTHTQLSGWPLLNQPIFNSCSFNFGGILTTVRSKTNVALDILQTDGPIKCAGLTTVTVKTHKHKNTQSCKNVYVAASWPWVWGHTILDLQNTVIGPSKQI